MLQKFPVSAALPASDFGRAKKFYQETLGFKMTQESPGGARFDAGAGSYFFVYPSEFAGTNQATAAGFEVDDVGTVVDDLVKKGITFEKYDIPGTKTDARGIVEFPEGRGAFFKDSEGNIIAVTEMP